MDDPRLTAPAMYGDTRTNPDIHDGVNEAMMDAYAIDPAYQTFTILIGDWVSNGDRRPVGDHQH